MCCSLLHKKYSSSFAGSSICSNLFRFQISVCCQFFFPFFFLFRFEISVFCHFFVLFCFLFRFEISVCCHFFLKYNGHNDGTFSHQAQYEKLFSLRMEVVLIENRRQRHDTATSQHPPLNPAEGGRRRGQRKTLPIRRRLWHTATVCCSVLQCVGGGEGGKERHFPKDDVSAVHMPRPCNAQPIWDSDSGVELNS